MDAVTILITDDDPKVRAMVRAVLNYEGYQSLMAENGTAALEVLRASPDPMIVLLDNRMPCMDATAVLEIVANDSRLQTHAFILMTGTPLRELPSALMPLLRRLNAPILAKPFEISVLLDAVAVAQHRLCPAA